VATITIRETPTNEDEELIYDSKNFWNGARRLIDDIDGDMKQVNSGYCRMNASGNPRLDILGDAGDCHAILITDAGPSDDPETFGRFYLGKCNYNMKIQRRVRFLTESAITDSTKVNARHQFRQYCVEVLGMSKSEADKIPDTKVLGGLGFHVKRKNGGTEIEIVHGAGGSCGCDKEVTLPFTIKTGEYYDTIYTVWHDNDTKTLYEKQEIEYPIGSGHKEIVNVKCTNVPSQFFNQKEIEEWSEIWVGRLNGEGGKIEYERVQVWKLNKKPAGLAN
jgi:hypothetical protein